LIDLILKNRTVISLFSYIPGASWVCLRTANRNERIGLAGNYCVRISALQPRMTGSFGLVIILFSSVLYSDPLSYTLASYLISSVFISPSLFYLFSHSLSSFYSWCFSGTFYICCSLTLSDIWRMVLKIILCDSI